jgi:uncharacterized protein DUF4386
MKNAPRKTEGNDMSPSTRTARFAGLLYLLLAITGFFTIIYVPSVFVVPGDAAATVERISASEALYRLGIAVDLLSQIIFILLVVTLYQLFKEVDRKQALLMVIFVVSAVPVSCFNIICQIAPLRLLHGPTLASVFEQPQRDSLVMLFLSLRGTGIVVDSVFWGLWLLPFASLVIKSGFIPKVLGYLLILAGVAYLVGCFASILLPARGQAISLLMIPLEAGELPIIFWLLIKGTRTQPPKEHTS